MSWASWSQPRFRQCGDHPDEIAEIAGVTQAEDVTGPYDVIVRATAENVDELGKLVAAQIQAVRGSPGRDRGDRRSHAGGGCHRPLRRQSPGDGRERG